MKLIKLQLITLRAFCLSLIALIDVCLQEEVSPLEGQDISEVCQHKDIVSIPTMGGGTHDLCRICGVHLPVQSEGE